MSFVQVMIFIFGASGIWFVSRKEEWKRWGYIFGLMGQPFWFYTALVNQQWGILALTVFYTYSWSQGIYNYWIKR
jgi:nicotinamide riboside transporter PnuC